MSFAYPAFLALIAAVIPMIWLAARRRKTVGHSQVEIHRNVRSVPLIGWIPTLMLVLMWIALCVAMARPQLTEYTEKQTIQSRDFVVLVDISGSMSSPLADPNQQTFAGNGNSGSGSNGSTGQTGSTDGYTPPQTPTRASAALQGVKLFLSQRQGDRVALLLFDDQVYYAWPLSTDLSLVDKKLPLILTSGGGTNFDGPSDAQHNIGGIQGAIDHFKEEAEGGSKTKVLIMVTDGEDSIDPKRAEELTAQMKAMGIHMYVLGVGEDWLSGSTPDLQKFAEGLGGKVIVVGDAQMMRDGFATINQLEKASVEIDRQEGHRDIYQIFLFAALGFAFLYKVSSALVRDDE